MMKSTVSAVVKLREKKDNTAKAMREIPRLSTRELRSPIRYPSDPPRR
jgi:hypothetical protein